MVAIFTEKELEAFNLYQLRRLADFYSVTFELGTKKSELIKRLYQYVCEPEPSENVIIDGREVRMSTRVRRIYEMGRKTEWKT